MAYGDGWRRRADVSAPMADHAASGKSANPCPLLGQDRSFHVVAEVSFLTAQKIAANGPAQPQDGQDRPAGYHPLPRKARAVLDDPRRRQGTAAGGRALPARRAQMAESGSRRPFQPRTSHATGHRPRKGHELLVGADRQSIRLLLALTSRFSSAAGQRPCVGPPTSAPFIVFDDADLEATVNGRESQQVVARGQTPLPRRHRPLRTFRGSRPSEESVRRWTKAPMAVLLTSTRWPGFDQRRARQERGRAQPSGRPNPCRPRKARQQGCGEGPCDSATAPGPSLQPLADDRLTAEHADC